MPPARNGIFKKTKKKPAGCWGANAGDGRPARPCPHQLSCLSSPPSGGSQIVHQNAKVKTQVNSQAADFPNRVCRIIKKQDKSCRRLVNCSHGNGFKTLACSTSFQARLQNQPNCSFALQEQEVLERERASA